MVTNRDDFTIAVRSAFLRKHTKQKFSLLALIVISFVLLSLEMFDFKAVNVMRAVFKDVIYRGSVVASIPGNFTGSAIETIGGHFSLHERNQQLREEILRLKNKEINVNYLKTENEQLKNAIEKSVTSDFENIIARVLVDKDSPFLKSAIINKGFNSNLKKGMPVLDGSYLVGRLTEVNYLSSRVLLISDLNSRIPVTIEPNGYQAIITGSGKDYATVDYLPRDHKLENGNLVYTSGTDGIFKPGIPIGAIETDGEVFVLKFFSDLNQLYLVNVVVEVVKDN